MKQYILIASFFFALHTYGQRDFYAEGDALIQSGQFAQAESLFRDAMKAEPANIDYAVQLGVCLLQQNKLAESEQVLSNILTKNANNPTALWYIAVAKYSGKKYTEAAPAFEKVLPLLEKDSQQYPSAFWFIGKSYSAQLKDQGISSKEADRMFECYDEYLRLQPNAPDAPKIREFVKLAKQNRPAQINDKWIAK